MPSRILPTLRSKPTSEQARLIGNMRNYVMNLNLVNLMNSYDINSNKNDSILAMNINAFNTIPGIKQQITTWLSN